MVRGDQAVGGVIFDMDGLILDTEPIYRLAFQQAAADVGYRIDDEFYSTLVGLNYEDTQTELLRTFGGSFPLESFGAHCGGYWHAYVGEHGIPRKAGLSELLEELDELDTPRAVATCSSEADTWLSLRVAGLEERFDSVVTADQVEKGKPAPDIFLAAAAELHVPPALCLVLEDSDAGVLAATAAGMRVILVPDLKEPSPHSISLALDVVQSLHKARPLLLEMLTAGSRGQHRGSV